MNLGLDKQATTEARRAAARNARQRHWGWAMAFGMMLVCAGLIVKDFQRGRIETPPPIVMVWREATNVIQPIKVAMTGLHALDSYKAAELMHAKDILWYVQKREGYSYETMHVDDLYVRHNSSKRVSAEARADIVERANIFKKHTRVTIHPTRFSFDKRSDSDEILGATIDYDEIRHTRDARKEVRNLSVRLTHEYLKRNDWTSMTPEEITNNSHSFQVNSYQRFTPDVLKEIMVSAKEN